MSDVEAVEATATFLFALGAALLVMAYLLASRSDKDRRR